MHYPLPIIIKTCYLINHNTNDKTISTQILVKHKVIIRLLNKSKRQIALL